MTFKKDTDSLNKIFGILLDFIFNWNPEIRRTQFLIYYFRRLLLTYLGLTLDKSSYSVFTHGTHFVAYLLSQVHLKISIVKCNFFQMLLHFTQIKNLKLWMRQDIFQFVSANKVIFIWSIIIRAVIDHMTCYNFNWHKIKF